MDIFSHGLWAAAAAQGINLKAKKRLSVGKFAAWGVFPDLFAFTVAFGAMVFTGMRFDPHDAEPYGGNGHIVYQLTHTLYNMSHSMIVFAAVFGLAWLLFRRPLWEMGGWLLHIVMDVPTHSYAFFPTPILWPASGWKFNGISWSQSWFIVADFSALAVTYLIIWYAYQQKRKR